MGRVTVVALASFVLACGPEMFASGDATVDQLRARAAFDMDCPKAELKTTAIDERTRGVAGCGQRLTYVEQCDRVGQWGAKDNCTWVLNTDSKRRKKADDDSN
jgi:hypothetical protein